MVDRIRIVSRMLDVNLGDLARFTGINDWMEMDIQLQSLNAALEVYTGSKQTFRVDPADQFGRIKHTLSEMDLPILESPDRNNCRHLDCIGKGCTLVHPRSTLVPLFASTPEVDANMGRCHAQNGCEAGLCLVKREHWLEDPKVSSGSLKVEIKNLAVENMILSMKLGRSDLNRRI